MATYLLVLLVGVAVGAVSGYLVLRANPNKKAVVDNFTQKQSNKLKNR